MKIKYEINIAPYASYGILPVQCEHFSVYVKRFRINFMCLAVPSKIIEINDTVATVDVDGVTRETSILLLEDAKIGDYVIVHAGFAISKLDEESALQTLTDMRNILAADADRA